LRPPASAASAVLLPQSLRRSPSRRRGLGRTMPLRRRQSWLLPRSFPRPCQLPHLPASGRAFSRRFLLGGSLPAPMHSGKERAHGKQRENREFVHSHLYLIRS
jgi:hypothetical protein